MPDEGVYAVAYRRIEDTESAHRRENKSSDDSGWSELAQHVLPGQRGSYDLPSPYAPKRPVVTASDFGRLGLRMEEAQTFQQIAQEEGWDIFVRTGNLARTRNVGTPGSRPKMAGLYQKTNKEEFLPGFVMYTERELEKAMSDLERIHHPGENAPESMQVLAQEGLGLRAMGKGFHGLRDEAGNFIYGDIDIHGVYKPDGRSTAMVAADTFVPKFNEKLIATGLHSADLLEPGTVPREKEFGVLPHSPIQHGAHDEWTRRNDPTYIGGVNMGPLPGVIHFSAREQPYHIESVPQYRDVLKKLGITDTYTGAAWSTGRNRAKTETYRTLPDKR